MKIAIIGTGNVAYHLIRKFSESESIVLYVLGRNKDSLLGLQQEFPNLRLLSGYSLEHIHVDLILICVKDDSLNAVFHQYRFPNYAVVAHTSGSQFLEQPSHHPFNGVFYPLQSFSKQIPLNWSKTPMLLEAASENAYKILEKAASLLGAPTFEVNQQQRFRIHMAAVITSNFINHLIGKAEELLQKDQIDYHILQPLIEETIRKAFISHPSEVQTGPAIRQDETILNKHLIALENDEALQKIYTDMTKSIQKTGNLDS
ncbi:MAG: DUF2520 domain-containing protein [Cytophagales bacterium]|nr:DUF2520 domain-containing protein [Cytophaga sp.]